MKFLSLLGVVAIGLAFAAGLARAEGLPKTLKMTEAAKLEIVRDGKTTGTVGLAAGALKNREHPRGQIGAAERIEFAAGAGIGVGRGKVLCRLFLRELVRAVPKFYAGIGGRISGSAEKLSRI